MKKIIMFLLVLAIIIPGLWASGDQESGSEHKMKIGLSLFSLTAEYLATLKDNMLNYWEEQGLKDEIEIIILDAGSDSAKQISQIDNLITQQVDAIIMVPFDREQLAPSVVNTENAGIPMVLLAAKTVNLDKATSYVGSDDIVSGRLQMEDLAQRMGGKGNLVILHGHPGTNAEVLRHTGAHEILEKYPDIKIVAEKICEWDRALALQAVENLLQSDMKIDAIFSENDEMSMGAAKAIEGSGADREIFIGGVDAIPDALQAVNEGILVNTVFQNNRAQAEKALQVAIDAAKGKSVEKLYDIPYELVTSENVDLYLDK